MRRSVPKAVQRSDYCLEAYAVLNFEALYSSPCYTTADKGLPHTPP